jgi:hypothetical protein
VTPKKYLAQNILTAHLKRLGVTRKQLDGVEFQIPAGAPFSDWPVNSRELWPEGLLYAKHVWCTFRWLIIADPPWSPDRDAAWSYVAWYLKGLDESKGRDARRVKAAQKESNKNRKSKADQEVLAAYHAWERRVAAQLSGADASKRVKLYLKVKDREQLADRQRRRLRALLKSGAII